MAELKLYNHVSENKRDYIEQDLAEKLSREAPKNSSDELQLAALLGKTLLEKNAELEQTLRRLQDFSEEALSSNESLSRQLSESKDSLQFSNQLCEQLEARVDELEKSNAALRKLSEVHEVQLEQRAAAMKDLEEKLDSVQREYQRVKEHSESLELSQMQAMRLDRMKVLRKKSTSFSGELGQEPMDHVDGEEREQKLTKTVDELTEKVRVVSYQKQKYEKGIQELLAENQLLTRGLERAETDILELQARLRVYEEAMEKQSFEQSFGSPMPHTLSVSSTPTSSAHVFQYSGQYSGGGSVVSPSEDTHKSPRITLGASLFSELDNQYSDVQEHYDELVRQCTCAAGLVHRNRLKPRLEVETGENLVPLTSISRAAEPPAGTRGPLKDLFDEVFATLQQTAAVADKLVEREKNSRFI